MKPPEWWPPDDGEPIGPERVDELFAFIRDAAPAAVEAARAYLAGRYPGTEPRVYAVPREQLADLALDPRLGYLSVGSVTARKADDGFCVVNIAIARSGSMAIGYQDEQLRPTWVLVG